MGRGTGALAGAVLACLVLAGCGSTDGGADAAPTSSAPASAPTNGPGQFQLRLVERVRTSGATCPASLPPQPTAGEPVTLCDEDGRKYQLEPASWAGTVTAAEAEVPDLDTQWVVNVVLPGDGASALGEFSTEHAGDGTQLALVLDGRLVMAAVLSAPVTDGKIQLVGDYTEKAAKDLADRLAGR